MFNLFFNICICISQLLGNKLYWNKMLLFRTYLKKIIFLTLVTVLIWFQLMIVCYFCFCFWNIPGNDQGLLLTLHSDKMPCDLRVSYQMLEIKPRSATCKASVFPALLSLWPYIVPLKITSILTSLYNFRLVFNEAMNLLWAWKNARYIKNRTKLIDMFKKCILCSITFTLLDICDVHYFLEVCKSRVIKRQTYFPNIFKLRSLLCDSFWKIPLVKYFQGLKISENNMLILLLQKLLLILEH